MPPPIQPKQKLTFKSGMPGMLQYMGYMVKPQTIPDPTTPIVGGSAGFYKVVLTLARPGYPLHPEGQLSGFPGLQGDSHLAIAKPAYSIADNDDVKSILINAQTEDGSFQFIGTPNSKGFLGQITAESIWGQSAQDARIKVSRAVASSLSSLSAQLDIPLMVYQADMIELATGNFFMSIISPYPERPLAIAPTGSLSKEFRANSSLYREALNSNTPAEGSVSDRGDRLEPESHRFGNTL
jgi:hypothetical protein